RARSLISSSIAANHQYRSRTVPFLAFFGTVSHRGDEIDIPGCSASHTMENIIEGSDAGEALRNSLDLAKHVEALGYRRYWMAEHHNLPGIACAATAVALAHIAGGTERIKIGAGGVMLPNHAPLVIAEQFGTLAGLHP